MRSERSYPALTLRRAILVYAALFMCRICFLAYNSAAIGCLSAEEIPMLVYGAFRFDTISFIYAFGPWLLLSLIPTGLRWRRWYRETLFWYYSVALFISVALSLSDAVYFRYTGKRITAEEMFFASNSNSMELIFRFMWDNWYMVATGAAIIAGTLWCYGRRTPIRKQCTSWYSRATGTAVLCAVTTLGIAGVRGGLSRMARPTSIPYATQFASDGARANLILSNPFCVIRTIGFDTTGVPHYFPEEQVGEVFSPLHHPSVHPAPCQGRNVVIFVMESMSAEHSALLMPEAYAGRSVKGYTPFLDSLMENGYTYMHMYASGKRSIQALPSIWSSIPSLKEPFMLMAESLGRSRALPAMMRDHGYSTLFFCGSERGSMGFDAYARQAGFERCYSMDDYTECNPKDDFDGYWGIWDDRFMEYMGGVLDSVPQPFMASMFTISSHHPFVVPDRVASSIPDGETPVQKCVRFVDDGVRAFFEKYSRSEWFANTLFVFVADHVSSEKMLPVTERSPEDHHIIGFMYTPDLSLRGKYAAPASQLDVMPSVLGLTGISEPYYAFGCDTFEDSSTHPCVVVYDNVYKAFTDQYVYEFDNGRISAVYSTSDIGHTTNLVPGMDVSEMEGYIRAYIQQYYTSISRKDYTVPASF